MNGTPPDMTEDPTLAEWIGRQGERLPAGYADLRLARERHKARAMLAVESSRWRAALSPQRLVRAALRASGTLEAGRRNAREIERVRRRLAIDALPSPLEGLRLLHLSDPHFGADPEIDRAIADAAATLEHDLCVMTGDYRFHTAGSIEHAIAGLARLREGLGEAVVAVLGNHDALAMAPRLEALGVRLLLNECATLHRGDALLHLVGVDDPRYYRLDDLGRALAGRSRAGDDTAPVARERDVASATLVLAHSPEIAEAAAAAGCDAYLCGHTHGGQICLPGGIPIMRNARAPAERLSGAWRLDRMRGYTSRGAGVSLAPARFFCPPEITLHTLVRA